jgi:protein-S-isoprenylcysteine O-methyltransferase Ste14
MDGYQMAAFALWCAFYLAYIAKMVLLARQGIQGSILGKNALEKALLAVTYGGAAIQFISIVFPQWVWSFQAFPTAKEGGLLLMLLGVVCFIAAMGTMRNNWRAGFSEKQNTSLVTHGIYRISRNPAFVGFDLLYIGCALIFPNALNLLICFLAVVLFHRQILSEEQFLSRTFGMHYTAYCKSVMRYVGRHK